MIQKIILSGVFIVFLGSPLSFADSNQESLKWLEDSSVQLEPLLDYALKNNPDWKATQLQVEHAQKGIDGASGWKDPMIKVTQFGESIETRLGPQERVISLSQKLPFWGEVEWAEKSAQAQKQATQKKVEWEKLNLITAVKHTYYQLWELQESARLLKENQMLVEKLSALGSADAGNYTGTLRSVFKAQSQLGQSVYDLLLVQEALSAAQTELNTLLGGIDYYPLPEIAEPAWFQLPHSLEELIELAKAHNPLWLAWSDQVQQVRYKREQAESRQWAPNIEVGINYFEIGEAENPNLEESGKDAYNFSIGFNLPFGSSNRSKAQQLQIEEQQTQMRQQNQENKLKEKITKLFLQLQDAKRLVELFESDLLPQAVRSKSIAESLYRSGEEQAVAVLEAENVLLQFQVKTLKAKTKYLSTLSLLEQWVGVSLQEKLNLKNEDRRP